MADTTTPDNKQTISRSAKLPSTSPEGVHSVIAAVAQIAGPVSRERLASHMGKQNTGAFSRAIGSAILYGFLETDSEKKLIITDRGSAFVGSDQDVAKRAKREGLATTGFGVVLKKLSTRAASEPIVALRLQEDLNVQEAPARDRAALLVAAAEDAGFVVNGNIDGGVLEDTFAVIGNPEPPNVTTSKKSTATRATSRTPKPTTNANGGTADTIINGTARDATSAPPAGRRDKAAGKVELPSTTPAGTKRVVTALAELAGPASRERVAGRLKAQLTGRLAAAIGSALRYGFMDVDNDDKLVMTARGHALIGDDVEASKRAQREALMSTGFASTVKRLRTYKADQQIVSARLQEDLGLEEPTATERAKVLVKAAADAGLAVDGRFDTEAIEDTIQTIGEPMAPTPAVPKPSAKPQATAAKATSPTPKATTNGGDSASGKGGGEPPPAPFPQAPPAPLQIVLQIDASKLGAEEIGAIVRELRTSATVSTSGS